MRCNSAFVLAVAVAAAPASVLAQQGCEVTIPTPFRLLEAQTSATGPAYPARTRARAIAFGTAVRGGTRAVRVAIDTAEGWVYLWPAQLRGCPAGSIAARPGDVVRAPTQPAAPVQAPPPPPPPPPPPAAPPRACVPGSTQACLCVGGRNGVQTCTPDGAGYQPCECAPLPDPCARANSCGTCTPLRGCGWCGGTGQCVTINATCTAPATGACGSGWACRPTDCEPSPQQPAPSLPARPVAVSSAEFGRIFGAVRVALMDEQKVSIVQDLVRGGTRHFTCEQAAALMRLSSLDFGRTDMGVALYPYLVDPENFYLLTQTYLLPSSADDLRRRVRR